MTHLPTTETFELLSAYFVAPERKAIAEIGRRIRSRKIRRGTCQLQHRGRSISIGEADFSDPESQRVFDAAAGVVARELGRQAGREWFDRRAGRNDDDAR